jgi:DNA-binding HxlR family transcriptional regulator
MPPTPRWDASTDIRSRAFCPRFHEAVELIGRRWTGAIVRVLLGGPHRFSELAAAVPGISERLLAQRLRELEASGIVVRRVIPGPPVGVEYELTRVGHDLEAVVTAVAAWAHRWGGAPEGRDPRG